MDRVFVLVTSVAIVSVSLVAAIGVRLTGIVDMGDMACRGLMNTCRRASPSAYACTQSSPAKPNETVPENWFQN